MMMMFTNKQISNLWDYVVDKAREADRHGDTASAAAYYDAADKMERMFPYLYERTA